MLFNEVDSYILLEVFHKSSKIPAYVNQPVVSKHSILSTCEASDQFRTGRKNILLFSQACATCEMLFLTSQNLAMQSPFRWSDAKFNVLTCQD